MLRLALLAVFVFNSIANPNMPIPPTPDGYALGSNTPTLHIEGFFDLLCSECKDTWGMLEPILRNEYHITTNQTLRFTFHVFSPPFHRNSFLMNQGLTTVATNMKDIEDVFTYVDLIFNNQDSFSQSSTQQITNAQIRDNLINLVSTNMPSYAQAFANGLNDGDPEDMLARIGWKYGVYRGVTTTSCFFANGIFVDGAGSFTADDWRNFLNGGYLQSSSPYYYIKKQLDRIDL